MTVASVPWNISHSSRHSPMARGREEGTAAAAFGAKWFAFEALLRSYQSELATVPSEVEPLDVGAKPRCAQNDKKNRVQIECVITRRTVRGDE